MTGPLYSAVRARLGSTGLPLTEATAQGSLEVPGFGTAGTWRLIAEVHEDRRAVIVYSLLPDAVPAERRTDVALLLNRFNFGLAVGNFELDVDTGELRFRTTFVAPGDVDHAALDEVIGYNLTTFNEYLPLIEERATAPPLAH